MSHTDGQVTAVDEGRHHGADEYLEEDFSKVKSAQIAKVQSLGSVRLRTQTGDMVLIPTPTNEPNDPLVRFSNKGES